MTFDPSTSMAVNATLANRAKDLKGSGILGKSINAGINPIKDSIIRNLDSTQKKVQSQKRSILGG